MLSIGKIIEDTSMVEPYFTKKNRKPKNRRWVKKFNKKYRLYKPMTDFYYDESHATIICHPTVAVKLSRYINNLPKVELHFCHEMIEAIKNDDIEEIEAFLDK